MDSASLTEVRLSPAVCSQGKLLRVFGWSFPHISIEQMQYTSGWTTGVAPHRPNTQTIPGPGQGYSGDGFNKHCHQQQHYISNSDVPSTTLGEEEQGFDI